MSMLRNLPSKTRAGRRHLPWRHRRISRSQMYWMMALTVVIWLASIGSAMFWLYEHWQTDVRFNEQALTVHLPDQLLTHVDFRSKINTRLDADLALRIPVKQSISIELPDTVSGQSHVNLNIPVDTEISHQFTTQVQTTVNTWVSIASWLPDIYVTLPLSMDIPIAVRIPVKATIPVSANLHATAKLPRSIQVPIDTNLQIKTAIHQPMSIDASHRTLFALRTTEEGIPMVIQNAQIQMPLSDLQLRPVQASANAADQ